MKNTLSSRLILLGLWGTLSGFLLPTPLDSAMQIEGSTRKTSINSARKASGSGTTEGATALGQPGSRRAATRRPLIGRSPTPSGRCRSARSHHPDPDIMALRSSGLSTLPGVKGARTGFCG